MTGFKHATLTNLEGGKTAVNGQIGMIVRGMIFAPNNEGYNKDGTYDKYRIRVGGD